MLQLMKLLDWNVTSSLQRVQERQQQIISPMRPAPPWTWVTGSPFPLWSLLGSCSGLFHLWIQWSSMRDLCPLWKLADCPLQGTTTQVLLSLSPSSALNSGTEAMAVKGFTDPFSSWESKACWRRCWGLIRPQSGGKLVILGTCCRAWEEDGASAEWLLGCCIPATLGKQINWPDWEMTDPCQSCEQLPSILCPSLSTSCSGFGSVEVLLSSSSFTPAQLNCGDPFGMLVRKQLMPAWLRRGSTCRDSPAKRSPGKAIPPYSGIHSSSFGNNQLFW